MGHFILTTTIFLGPQVVAVDGFSAHFEDHFILKIWRPCKFVRIIEWFLKNKYTGEIF
jgi:hypothetical protein